MHESKASSISKVACHTSTSLHLQALCAAAKLPPRLLEKLLKPQPSPEAAREAATVGNQLRHSGLSPPMCAALSSAYNPSQLSAIAASTATRSQTTLVQVCSLRVG